MKLKNCIILMKGIYKNTGFQKKSGVFYHLIMKGFAALQISSMAECAKRKRAFSGGNQLFRHCFFDLGGGSLLPGAEKWAV